jgi:hypothetical protein
MLLSDRAWGANNRRDLPHSHLWLDAGWRTATLNMTEGRVSFARVREREKAYIDFFGRLLAGLREKASFLVREVSPDGTSWVICQTISSLGFIVGQFNYSFARDQRFRIELYIDTNDYEISKAVSDRIHAQRLLSKLNLVNWLGSGLTINVHPELPTSSG